MQVSKKIKKLLFACIFSTVVVLALKMASFLMAPQRIGMQNAVSAGEKYYLNLLMEPEDMVDVIIFGDSESISFLSTYDLWKDCGIASYVAGQPGDRVVRSYYKLKEILKTQSPKVVILETNELYFNADTLNQIDYIRESMIDYYFPVFRYHSLWKQLVCKSDSSALHFNGFELRPESVAYTGGEYMLDTAEQAPLATPVKIYLDKLRRLCKKKGIELVLVTSPSPLNHTTQRHNALTAYADQYDLPYLDLNMNTEEIGLDWTSDTLDGGDHVNYSGSKKITAYIEKYLNEHYTLVDHRADAKYEEWNSREKEFSSQFQ